MAPKQPPSEAVRQIHFLAAALKAPRIVEAAGRLADQARDAGWTHEDYLAAVLDARSLGPQRVRRRAAHPRRRYPARKTLDDFDWDHQPAARQQVATLASGAFLTEARNIDGQHRADFARHRHDCRAVEVRTIGHDVSGHGRTRAPAVRRADLLRLARAVPDLFSNCASDAGAPASVGFKVFGTRHRR